MYFQIIYDMFLACNTHCAPVLDKYVYRLDFTVINLKPIIISSQAYSIINIYFYSHQISTHLFNISIICFSTKYHKKKYIYLKYEKIYSFLNYIFCNLFLFKHFIRLI